VKIFDHASDLVADLADELFEEVEKKLKTGEKLNIALSGGGTPDFFYKYLAKTDSLKSSLLNSINIFWVDERCVPPDSEESNFRKVNSILLEKKDIDPGSVFRIRGEDPPEEEALRYSKVLKENLPEKNSFPFFDIIFLGVGTDGHIASLFPESPILNEKKKFTAVTIPPENGIKRVTLTLPVINNAGKIIFLVTGAKKRNIVRTLCNYENRCNIKYPASLVKNRGNMVEWYVDNFAWSIWEQDSDI
jgi:6-phosphogluconolactonase